MKPTDDMVRAITEARNVFELKAFQGLILYYGKFIPHLSSVFAQVYKLLRMNASWWWKEKDVGALQKVKEMWELSIGNLF